MTWWLRAGQYRAAHDDGVTVIELHTSRLSTPPEEAVIQARIGTCREDAHAQEIHDEAGKVRDALRTAGWRPVLRIKDIEITRAGPSPGAGSRSTGRHITWPSAPKGRRGGAETNPATPVRLPAGQASNYGHCLPA